MKVLMPYSVLLVDDHKIMLDSIKSILERTSDFRVVGEAVTGTDGVNQSRKLHPELVLIDIGLPGMNGIEVTNEVLRQCPDTKVIMLSMYDDEKFVVAAFRSGARAFVLKKASSDDLVAALRTVARGGLYASPQVSDHLLTHIQRGDMESKGIPGPLDRFSPREQLILRLVAEGKTSKDIAVMLDLGLHTVQTYRKALMKKVGATNIAMLTQVAHAAGLITRGPPRL
jgi:NarL family two-component system response regulator LiaR